MNRSVLVSICLVLTLFACGSSGSEVPDGSTSGPPADCIARCSAKAQTCGAPASNAAQECGSLCPSITSSAQLLCLESTSCSELVKLIDHTGTVCDIGDDGPPPGAFGDACKCDPDSTSGSGDFECSGTNICSSGLHCVGTRIGGVDHGRCRGPVCCTGTQECAAVLGKQGAAGNCDTGQECYCVGGIECVGDKCTCLGGVPATEGLCYPGT